MILCFVVGMVLPLLLAVRQPTAAASSTASALPEAPAPTPSGVASQPPPRSVAARSAAALAPAASRSRAQTPEAGEEVTAAQVMAQELARAPEPGVVPRAPETSPLASVGGLSLVVPAAADVEVVVGFHEAGRGDAAALDPDHDEHEVMPSRGRGTEPTSAVDVAVPEGSVVVSPVDGVVTTAVPYQLYGATRDDMVVVEPDDHPDVAVHLLHLASLEVAEGDRVVAGETPVGVVRTLPFGSQIDRLTGDTRPHVHIEVRSGG